MTDDHVQALPAGFRLHEYRIDRVLGSGGFGITYLAWETNLDKAVAIKEYLPPEFAARRGDATVRPRSPDESDGYFWGLERFLKEAQTLARFRHPAIVPVYRFFEAHGTAYMVMEYQEGESFGQLMKRRKGTLTEEELLAVALPLLDGLEEVHRAGFLHRDVKPSNVIIRKDGHPVLLDFGAARDAIGRQTMTITSLVTPGYSPLEQYFSDGHQGPWTDLYSLGAILYQAVTGTAPPDAAARVRRDPMRPAAEAAAARFSPHLLQAIDRALAVEEERRPQTVAEWRDMLTGKDKGAAMPAPAPVARPAPAARLRADPVVPRARRRGQALPLLVAALLVAVVVGAGVWLASDNERGRTIAQTPADTGAPGPARSPEDPPPGVRAAQDAGRAAAEATIRQAEEEARRVAEEAGRRAAEAERQRQAQEAARMVAEEEARRRAEAEARERAEAEQRRQAAAEAEERRIAEDARRAEATRRAEEARRAAEARQQQQGQQGPGQTAALGGGVECPAAPRDIGAVYETSDCFLVQTTFQNTMQTAQEGSTSNWRNSRSGNSGSLTVLRNVQGPNGYCREFRQTVTVGGRTHQGEGRACLQPDNSWRIGG